MKKQALRKTYICVNRHNHFNFVKLINFSGKKRKGMEMCKLNQPYLMEINGLLGVVCHNCVVETNEMVILSGRY